MKAFICSLLILALLISGFIVNYTVLKNKSMILSEKLEMLKGAVKEENEEKINSSYEDIIHHWKKHNRYMLMFSNHSSLDNISASLIIIKEKINSKQYTDAKEEIELVISSLASLPQNETLKIENIF